MKEQILNALADLIGEKLGLEKPKTNEKTKQPKPLIDYSTDPNYPQFRRNCILKMQEKHLPPETFQDIIRVYLRIQNFDETITDCQLSFIEPQNYEEFPGFVDHFHMKQE